MSVANAVTLGTLVAIRPHGQALWTLGIVRRMKRLTTDRAEIGLQVIANTLVGVELVEQRKRARRRLFGRRRARRRSTAARSRACSCRCASATATPPCSR